jgi:soluble lytic murein transglycosylase-like protein
MTPLVRSSLLLTLAIALFPSTSAAQIYTSRDANGTIVLSNRRVDSPTQVFHVPGAPGYRTTTEGSRNAQLFEELVREHSQRQSLRPELVRAVIQVESGFNPGATSPKGAMGLMQLMPQTARSLGVFNAYDPAENIRGGTTYLRQLIDKFGTEQLALAAYNAGPGAVDKYDGIPPYRETKDYVRKVGSKAAGETPAAKKRTVIYKWYEIIGDRLVPKYAQDPPRTGPYEIAY